jgi:hypothetical protein
MLIEKKKCSVWCVVAHCNAPPRIQGVIWQFSKLEDDKFTRNITPFTIYELDKPQCSTWQL